MFPGQGSVAHMSRAALALSSAIPTPRVGGDADDSMVASVVSRTTIEPLPAEATRQIRRGTAHLDAASSPTSSGNTRRASIPIESIAPRRGADVSTQVAGGHRETLSPPSLTAVEAARREEPAASWRIASAAGLLAIAFASCAATLWMLGRTDHTRALHATFPNVRVLTAAAVSILRRPSPRAASPAAADATRILPTSTTREAATPSNLGETPMRPTTRTGGRSSHASAHRREPTVQAFEPASSVVAATGTLRVIALPWGEIEIDGRPYGSAPVAASIAAGMHRVRITGGVERLEQIDVQAGRTTVLRVDE
jgi:hypothetical protein